MDDDRVHDRIEALVGEEHELWQREAAGEASDGERRRLAELRVALDQCWDLLRQRRAHEEFGLDTGDTGVRRADVVEHYEQ